MHCGEKVFERMAQMHFDEIVTTYRSPKRVAASWFNRGNPQEKVWFEQWKVWGEIMKASPKVIYADESKWYDLQRSDSPPLHSFDDDTGLHQALDDGDDDYFYEQVPRNWIDFATGIANAAELSQPQ